MVSRKEIRSALKNPLIINDYERIYLINSKTIAKKFSTESLFSRESCIKEYNFGKYLEKKKISVPGGYQLIKPDCRNFWFFFEAPIKDWFIAMNKIDGKPINELDSSEREKAIELYKLELEKILDFGIYPGDSDYGENVLYDSNQEKVYLIDFQAWRFAKNVLNKKLIDSFYYILDCEDPFKR